MAIPLAPARAGAYIRAHSRAYGLLGSNESGSYRANSSPLCGSHTAPHPKTLPKAHGLSFSNRLNMLAHVQTGFG
jgi:hypothetical protein